MGEGQNSDSKTDQAVTFIRMKKEYILNGQLKPGCHVPIAVNSEYIIGNEAFPDRSNVKALNPFLHWLEDEYYVRYREVMAGTGYKS